MKICSRCGIEKPITSFNKEKRRKDGHNYVCRDCCKDIYKQNKHTYDRKAYNREYNKKFDVRLKGLVRRRLNSALKDNWKSGHTIDLLGCSISHLKLYLELQFPEGMSWDNYGMYGWHIDHIIPCASFDLSDPEQQRKCFHYTNLQPLWAEDNLKKGDKYVFR